MNYVQLPNMDKNKCFGCGPGNDQGLKMEFYGNKDHVYSDVTVPEHMVGWHGVVHGGITSTMLDEIMSWAAIFLTRKFILTKNMTVTYHKPVMIGDALRAESRILEKNGDREIVMTGEIFNSRGELSASSKGVFAVFEIDYVRKMGIMRDSDLDDIENMINLYGDL